MKVNCEDLANHNAALSHTSLGRNPDLPETRETDEAGVPEQSAEPEDLENPSITWVDSSHAYATDQVQALTVWMDNFFGDPTYDLEKPDSLVRLEWQNNWDEEDGYKGRVRLRGKLHMPRISKRLNLIFSGKDGDNLGADERKENTDLVGVQYSLGELNRSRVDLTLDAGTWDLRPGIRYRNQGSNFEAGGLSLYTTPGVQGWRGGLQHRRSQPGPRVK